MARKAEEVFGISQEYEDVTVIKNVCLPNAYCDYLGRIKNSSDKRFTSFAHMVKFALGKVFPTPASKDDEDAFILETFKLSTAGELTIMQTVLTDSSQTYEHEEALYPEEPDVVFKSTIDEFGPWQSILRKATKKVCLIHVRKDGRFIYSHQLQIAEVPMGEECRNLAKGIAVVMALNLTEVNDSDTELLSDCIAEVVFSVEILR